MPINTMISGNPDSVHATATWLRGQLAATINDTTVTVIRSREMSETSWTGPAAAAFGARMDRIRYGQDQLAGDIAKAAETLDQFAEDLHTAQVGMTRVVNTAIGAGLHVAEKVIFEPSSIGECWADPAVQAAADALHQRMLAAYEAACAEAQAVLLVFAAGAAAIAATWREIVEKQVMLATEFIGKTAERFSETRISELETKAQALKNNPDVARWRDSGITRQQLNAIGSEIAKLEPDVFWGKLLDKMATAGSIAYDIAHGKPPVKTVVTNTAGTAASSVVGKIIAEKLTTKALGAGAVAVLASGGGALAGVAVGVAAELAWDAMPQSWRDKIEKGANDLFEAGKKAVVTEWHDLENTADKIWRMLF